MKMHRHPMLDWGKTFSSMAECRVPERQFLALCWLTDSVCSYSDMWNKSVFQLRIYFLFPVWIHLLGTVFLKLWLLHCTVNTILWELSLLCSWRCLTAGAQQRPVQHMEHITWEATCWNRRVHAIFYIRTAKKVEGWAVWDISKARGCWNIDGSTQSFTSMLLKYTISIKSDRLEAKANNFVS